MGGCVAVWWGGGEDTSRAIRIPVDIHPLILNTGAALRPRRPLALRRTPAPRAPSRSDRTALPIFGREEVTCLGFPTGPLCSPRVVEGDLFPLPPPPPRGIWGSVGCLWHGYAKKCAARPRPSSGSLGPPSSRPCGDTSAPGPRAMPPSHSVDTPGVLGI